MLVSAETKCLMRIMKLAKYRLKAQVEKYEGSSGEGQSLRVEKDEGPSGELKLAKYMLKAQVEKDKGSSGEGQSLRVEKDEGPKAETLPRLLIIAECNIPIFCK